MARKDTPLPPELAAKWGHLGYIQFHGFGRAGNEWSAECPQCGSSGHVGNDPPDRFRMWDTGAGGNARGWCRNCLHFEFADQNVTEPPDPARILEAQEIRRKLQAQEQLRRKAKIVALQHEAYWKGWHDGMTEAQRAIWAQAGIPGNWADYWEFGYTPSYRGYAGDQAFESPALTIPYFAPGREVYNVQYRLLNPPKAGDKYRFTKGLTPGLWLADPDNEPSGSCLLCEGVKKAAVGYIKVVAELELNGMSVVAAPNKRPSEESLALLHGCDPIYIAFDPDAYEPTVGHNGKRSAPAAVATYKHLQAAGHDVRVLKLPMKLDDMLLTEGVDGRYIVNAMRRARVLS